MQKIWQEETRLTVKPARPQRVIEYWSEMYGSKASTNWKTNGERDIYVVIGCVGDPVYVVRPKIDSSGGAQTLHHDLLLPCRFLPQTEEANQPVSTPAHRPQTRSLQKLKMTRMTRCGVHLSSQSCQL